MMFLPLQDDSLLVHLCLYYGVLVLLLELLVPFLFQRRVRIEFPRLPLRPLAVPLSTREFQQRRRALRQQLAALHRALAETPRSLPRMKRQISGTHATHQFIASPLASSMSLTKASRSQSSRKTSALKRKSRRHRVENEVEDGGRRREASQLSITARPQPMAIRESRSSRHGGFTFDERNEVVETEEQRAEGEDWAKRVSTRIGRRRESLTFAGRRPVRFVDDMERGDYREAATSLNALIEARGSRTESSLPLSELHSAAGRTHSSAPVAGTVAIAPSRANLSKDLFAQEPKPKRTAALVTADQQDKQKSNDKDKQNMNSERREPLSEFQVFCASFAKGGSMAAFQTSLEQEHPQTFESGPGVSNHGVSTPRKAMKDPRLREHWFEQPKASAVAAALESINKRSYYEAFGIKDEREFDEAVVVQQHPVKRNYDGAFTKLERPQKNICRTPPIIRRISFDDEVNALAASASNVLQSELITGKRKHTQAFGMVDDEDDDTE